MYVAKIFYSYARQDKHLRDELEKHLEPLKRSGQITTWYDREIQPGKDWKQEIENHLNTADIILLLISPNFVSSNYCYGQEMQRAIARQAEDDVHIIPIILRPVKWQEMPIGNLQALPTNGKPVSRWRHRDDAFEDIVQGIHQVVMNYQLRKTNENIAQQVEEDTAQGTEGTDIQSRQLNLFTNQFLIDMNHMLRNPLTALSGNLELVIAFNKQLDDEERNICLKNATLAFDECMLVINWLTNLMSVQSQPIFSELLLAKVVQKAIVAAGQKLQISYSQQPNLPQDLKFKAGAEDVLASVRHPLHLDIPEDLVIKTDEKYILEILSNLLFNAWVYTPIDTPVNIQATFLGNGERQMDSSMSTVLICVKDFGPGIPSDELPRLFEPFQRLRRDLVGKIQGLGLGLYISKKLVETLDGQIWAESTGILGEGSCFYLTLPCGEIRKNIK